MWFFYTLISHGLMGTVNYIDEFLTSNNKIPEKSDIHTRIGGLILISTLMSFVGAFVIYNFPYDKSITDKALLLALLSAIPMVIMYLSYFYLLLKYPVHLIGPVFQLSTLWLLLFEVIYGVSVKPLTYIGILMLIYGAYVTDSGTFKLKFPTKLLIYSIPATAMWPISLFMIKVASEGASPLTLSFFQLAGIGIIGVLLFFFVKQYRNGFLYRIKKQGKVFLGLSLINETLQEGSYLFGNIAVSIAPVAAFIPALDGLRNLFVMFLFLIFPQGKRSKIANSQWVAVALITAGVFLIEFFK